MKWVLFREVQQQQKYVVIMIMNKGFVKLDQV